MIGITIYNEMRNSLSSASLREVVVASERKKCTRQSLREWSVALAGANGGVKPHLGDIKDWLTRDEWRLLKSTFKRYNLSFAVGTRRIHNTLDQGKGGWSNLISTSNAASDNDDAYIYIAADDETANSFRMADEAGDDALVASYLGIPRCCAEFFLMVWPAAVKRQGDLCPYTCAMTENKPYPWKWQINIVSQYFGGSLISFFPCSFNCSEAKKVSQNALSIIAKVDERWARTTRNLSKGVFLYTEYRGIHKWDKYSISGNQILLHCPPLSTAKDHQITRSNVIEYNSPHDMLLHVDSKVIHLSGPDVALCIF